MSRRRRPTSDLGLIPHGFLAAFEIFWMFLQLLLSPLAGFGSGRRRGRRGGRCPRCRRR
ncbi:MAG: hypothetical protein ACYC61_18065 [Isosphaeraceae bacterium]